MRPANHYAPWSPGDDRKLLRYVRLNKHFEWIMCELGRSEESLRQRLIKLYNAESRVRDGLAFNYTMDAPIESVIENINRQPSGYTSRASRAMWARGANDYLSVARSIDVVAVDGPNFTIDIVGHY